MPDTQYLTLGELFSAVGRLMEHNGHTCPTNIERLKLDAGSFRKVSAETSLHTAEIYALKQKIDDLEDDIHDLERARATELSVQ